MVQYYKSAVRVFIYFLPVFLASRAVPFQKKYHWIKLCSFIHIIKSKNNTNKTPIFECFNVSNPHASRWIVTNMDINLTNCSLPSLKLSSVADDGTLATLIQNSSFKSLDAIGKHKIKLINLNLYLNFEDNFVVKANTSEIQMKNCTFRGNSLSAVALLQTVQSEILMHNITVKSMKSQNGLVRIHKSRLTLKQVNFSDNGFDTSSSILLVSDNSSAFVSESNFENNTAINGSCFYVENNSFLAITNSTFSQNKAAVNGGVMVAESKSTVMLISSQFQNNSAQALGQFMTCMDVIFIRIEGCLFQKFNCSRALISVEQSSSMFLSNSTFEENYVDAQSAGSILRIVGKFNLSIQSAIFKSNKGGYKFVLVKGDCLNPPCYISINGAFFHNNTGLACVTVEDKTGKSKVQIHGSSFESNLILIVFAVFGSNMHLQLELTNFLHNTGMNIFALKSSLSAVDCVFSQSFSSVFVAEATVHLTRCTFSGSKYWAISGSTRNSISAHKCSFTNNFYAISMEPFSIDQSSCLLWNNATIFGQSVSSNMCQVTNTSLRDLGDNKVNLTRCTFSLNEKAMSVTNSTVFAHSCNFTESSFAAMDVRAARLVLTSCTFSKNDAAIYGHNSSRVLATNSSFTHNTRAISMTASSVDLSDCILSWNNDSIDCWNCKIFVTRCIFSHNSLSAIWGDTSELGLTSCTFEKHLDATIVGRNNSIISAHNCIFTNSTGNVIDLIASQIALTSCSFSTYEGVIYSNRNSNISAVNCSFTNNNGYAVIDAGVTHVDLTGCTFASNRATIIFLNLNASLKASETKFVQNGPGSAIECGSCVWIELDRMLFSENNPGKHSSLLQVDSHSLFLWERHIRLDLKHCMFFQNRHMLFSVLRAQFTCTKCAISHANLKEGDAGDTIIEAGLASITLNDSLFKVAVEANFRVEMSSSNMTFSKTKIRGNLLFRIQQQSRLELYNSSVADPNNGTQPHAVSVNMAVALVLSTLVVKNSILHLSGSDFVSGYPGSIFIQNCTLFVQIMLPGRVLFALNQKGSFSMYNTDIFVEVSDSEFFILRNFSFVGEPPPLNLLQELPCLFELLYSVVNLTQVRVIHRDMGQTTPQFSYWGGFHASNVTIDSSFFASMALFLAGEKSTHAVVVNSKFENGSTLYTYHNPDYIMIASSILTLYHCHCCYPTTNCERPMQALRLANTTTVLLQRSLENVDTFFTWKSVIQFQNFSYHTSDDKFMEKAAKSGMFFCSYCGKTDIRNNRIPDFSETKYTAGKMKSNTTFSFYSRILIEIHRHWFTSFSLLCFQLTILNNAMNVFAYLMRSKYQIF